MKTANAVLILAICAIVNTPARSFAQTAAQTQPEKLVALMLGRWVGTTSYHRNQDLKPSLPHLESPVDTRATWVTIIPGKKTGTIVMQIAWDDISKITNSAITMTFDLERHRLSYKYKDDDSGYVFDQLEGIDQVLAKGGGQITAIEQEPHSDEQRRITISLTRNLWMRDLESRKNSSAPWIEQHRILLTRDQPPTK